MFKKMLERPNVQFLCYVVLAPMIFALALEPSKWLAAGCVARCTISAWFFAESRWAQGSEAGLSFTLKVDDETKKADLPDDGTAISPKKESS